MKKLNSKSLYIGFKVFKLDSTMIVVFRDSSFKEGVVKTNSIWILKQYGIDEVVSV